MTKRWFITGTDTEIGKTTASCALLQAARSAGYRCAGYKPVASGCEITSEGLRNQDALLLQQSSSVKLPYQQVNPLAFFEPTSPHIVSSEEQRPIHLNQLSDGLQVVSQQAEWVLIEGAGGWYTPLSVEHTFADWVVNERLPVILVVGVKLGCINHALLTSQAIASSGLRLAGWIANGIQPEGRRHRAYMDTLRQRLDAPLLGEIPWLCDEENFTRLAQYVTLPC